ncbi:MAG: phosphate uptake regulator PhoU [archaeon]|nr:phosphate uptake regulator PhoU [archaeon]MCP8320618.1 phosphate uptake regulator PhoU [archaeon]
MEYRRLQKVGYSTLIVSLPNEWLRDAGLRKGDQVVMMPEPDGSLKLMPRSLAKPEIVPSPFTINSDLFDELDLFESFIVWNYVLGRDTIEITSAKEIRRDYIQRVKELVERFIGLNIMEETSNKIVLKCFIEPKNFPIDILIRRFFTIVLSIYKEAIDGITELEPDFLDRIANLKDEAEKIYWLIIRLILLSQSSKTISEKIGIKDSYEILDYRLLVENLEAVASQFKGIAEDVIRLNNEKERIGKQVLEAIYNADKLAYSIFSKALDCFYTGDMKLANDALKIMKDVEVQEELTEELLMSLNVKSLAYIKRILWAIRRMAEYSADIAKISMRRALVKLDSYMNIKQVIS